jgi:hypothetical protein
MSEQSKDAAERSAHVTRGPAAEGAALHPILERKNEKGQTTGQLRVVVELREENARLRNAWDQALAKIDSILRDDYLNLPTQTLRLLTDAKNFARAALEPRA